MKFSQKIKNEILSNEFENDCCKIACLSAFIRANGSIISSKGLVGFEVYAENKQVINYFNVLLLQLYGAEAKFSDALSDKTKYGRTVVTNLSTLSSGILADLGIISVDEQGLKVNLTVEDFLITNDCCKIAYLCGTFLGCGSITVPSEESKTSTGYHIEFVFTNYQSAIDFCEILSEINVLAKLVERKGDFVVYLQTREEIADLIAIMGANKCYFEFLELTVQRDFNNSTNRAVNCEMGNMTKQIDAGVKQIMAIELIKQTIGLEALPQNLQTVANARLNNKSTKLQELADILGISKSCLNHRLRKIIEISNQLK